MKRKLITAALLLATMAATAVAMAAPAAPAPARMEPAALRQAAEQFLQVQTAGLPGKVTVSVGAVDPRLNLAPCPAPEAFLMPGARAWGKTTVGVRCAAPSPWTVYIQSQVSVLGSYVAAAVPLAQGQAIEAGQLAMMQGELTALPPGIATDKAQLIGRTSNLSISAGTPLRLDLVKAKPVVLQGQLVKLVSKGNGFSVSAEGKAAGSAADGQVVAVRTGNGQQISGIARPGGLVEVTF
ncbi:flagellar basal body P-ring formation protein FlgA [Pseudoduganella sp. DS3]|uniref:Flagella basal body P-ring formation protein FlgA n=1 Tax=Pseudoduganella guangdongensis TaxID=2692179 RepID=A0A6N9HGA2_9BURK|nr:flagellar basal body P-ring formation chaperone FlgA [Pseudoduganella guangdongensis]MYN01855.1 flagellar basal body P-ring formation protein FlgA [Pseudoduganella guangdongensis]